MLFDFFLCKFFPHIFFFLFQAFSALTVLTAITLGIYSGFFKSVVVERNLNIVKWHLRHKYLLVGLFFAILQTITFAYRIAMGQVNANADYFLMTLNVLWIECFWTCLDISFGKKSWSASQTNNNRKSLTKKKNKNLIISPTSVLFLQSFFFVKLGHQAERAKKKFNIFVTAFMIAEGVWGISQAVTSYGRVATNASYPWVAAFLIQEAMRSSFLGILYIFVGIYFSLLITENISSAKLPSSKESLKVAKTVVL